MSTSPLLANNDHQPDGAQVFATLRLMNEPGRKAIHHLGERYSTLSAHNRHYLHVELIAQANLVDLTDDANAEYVPDISDLEVGQDWNGVYNISLSGFLKAIKGPRFGLTIGRGEPTAGVVGDRGVDLLVIYPTKHSKDVIGIHAVLRLHPQTGWLMLGGVSNEHPVRYIKDNDSKNLGAGKWHVMWQRVNKFFVGDILCSLTLSNLVTTQLFHWAQCRRELFQAQGLPLPDRRFPILPLSKPILHIGSVMVYREIECGGCATFSIGVDGNTGTPVAVKMCPIKDSATQEEMISDGEVALQFQGQPNLHQAAYMSCNHKHAFGQGQHEAMRQTLGNCRTPDVFFMVSELADSNFQAINIQQDGFARIVELFHGIIQGLATLHHAGYMHRDVTCANMLKMPGSIGQLWDFGKAIQRPSETSLEGGPRYTQAPEIDGTTRYTFKCDAWSYAFANGRFRKSSM